MVYYLLLSLVVFLGLLSLMWLYLYWKLYKGFMSNREKSSAFECGLDKKDLSRSPFSLKFFLMLMLFLIFDVELCLLMSLPYQKLYNFFGNRMFFIGMVMMLLVGVLEEYRRGALKWKK